jgi:hypothetical protein
MVHKSSILSRGGGGGCRMCKWPLTVFRHTPFSNSGCDYVCG